MKLKKLSRYFYRHPRVLFNGTFIFSVVLHTAMLAQLPFLRFTSLPAQKAKMTIINVSLQNLKVHSKTNVLRRKIEKPKEQKKELLKEIVKKEDTIPYLKKEEEKKELKKEEIKQEKFISSPPSVSKNIIIKARETYEDKILKRINAMKHYPMLARRKGQEGIVKVKFTLDKSGTLKGGIVIVKRCGYEILNEAAVKTIVRANPYPVFPHVIRKDEMTFVVDVDFRLGIW